MKEAIRYIAKENNPAKIGLIVSPIIICASLIQEIKIGLFSMSNPYSRETLLLGLSMFFFFMAIKVNMTSRIKIMKFYI